MQNPPAQLTVVNASNVSKDANDRQSETNIMKASDTITVIEGYDAVRLFLDIVSRRQSRTLDEISFILGRLTWADGSPVDQTMWEDWIAAVQIARAP